MFIKMLWFWFSPGCSGIPRDERGYSGKRE